MPDDWTFNFQWPVDRSSRKAISESCSTIIASLWALPFYTRPPGWPCSLSRRKQDEDVLLVLQEVAPSGLLAREGALESGRGTGRNGRDKTWRILAEYVLPRCRVVQRRLT